MLDLPDHPLSDSDFKASAPDLYPQSQADSHRHLRERQQEALQPFTSPGVMAIMRQDINRLESRAESAAQILTAANVDHHWARVYAFNALTGQRLTAEEFYQKYQAGALANG